MKENNLERHRHEPGTDCKATWRGCRDYQVVVTRQVKSRQVTYRWHHWMRLARILVRLVSCRCPCWDSKRCRRRQVSHHHPMGSYLKIYILGKTQNFKDKIYIHCRYFFLPKEIWGCNKNFFAHMYISKYKKIKLNNISRRMIPK